MPRAMSAACVPTTPPPRTATWAGSTPGDPVKEDAKTAMRLLQEVGSGLYRHPAGDLRHGREERQPAGRRGHRLVSDAGRAAFNEVEGLLRIRRKVKISEEDLARAQPPALLALRFIDLHYNVGSFENGGPTGAISAPVA